MIEFCNVTAFQQGTRVLSEFNLSIRAGERVAILGPNGAGKSTILKLITRDIYPVDRGGSHLRLFGNETVNLWDLRSKLGLVSQDLQDDYTPFTKALDVIVSGYFGAVGMHGHLQPTAEQREQALRMLDEVGMEGREEQMFQRLSTGQKRRLLLARALVHQPQALILDEPSNGLDLGSSVTMLSLLRQFCIPGRSIVITTHHLDEIIPEVDRVVLIKQGKILADGAKSEILTGPRLSDLYEADLHVTERGGWYRCWHD